jgi:transcriptional regulator with XRE-family HTH domain
VGAKIKSLREAKKISREDLAERAKLTLQQVANVEESDILPSLAPLIKIARALGVRLGTFLDDNDVLGPVVCRKDVREESINFSNNSAGARKNMEYFSLAGHKSGRNMEPFIINVQPCQEKDFILSSHEGEEFIYVLDGIVEINYGKETYLLEQGDSIYYDSIVPHHVHAAENAGAKILAVVYTPL